jgi:hypothetical protein
MSPGRSAEAALLDLARELRDEESVISAHVVDPSEPPTLGILSASGPRTSDRAAAYSLIIECVREGYLLHYERPRLLAPPDQDLALLAGDYLYAKGLERLAALGDLDSVRELSDLISLLAQLHAEGDERTAQQAAALWLASAVAIATGGGDPHERGKRAVRDGDSAEGLYAAALDAASLAGIDEQLAEAAEAVGFRPSHRG